ncbi:MAG: glycoside hydrolase family 26 protein [Bacteroidales bacterium]
MKRINLQICATMLLICCMACSPSKRNKPSQQSSTGVQTNNTSQVKGALLQSLKDIPSQGIMFGHHDDPLYGIGWDGDAERSDVKSVCGDYPALMSFDIGHLELGNDYSLDSVSFDRIRKEIIAQYNRGGMITISWHADNPLTGGDSWDVSSDKAVASVLDGGEKHAMFLEWLDRLSDYFNSLVADDGTKIPILFRPWHEHTGSWFWWGQELCSTEQYKALWSLTCQVLQENGVDNLLYAYSPGTQPNTKEEYLERYPEGDIIDLIGVDIYVYDTQQYPKDMERCLSLVSSIAKERNLAMALTETGYETIPDSAWWTETLLPLIENYPLSYVLVWRNARERENHFYAPYPGQVSAEDFVKFYDSPKTLFAKDVEKVNLYN